jgi:phospholipid/cholesterol/gamma-HCH transport system substrate-binding protein
MAASNQRIRDTFVGLFVLVALGATMIMVILLGSEQGIFRQRFELRAIFANVSGLREGAPVFVAGLNVGSVRQLDFAPPGEDGVVAARVEIVIDVDARYHAQFREDSVATVGSVGLLGDKSIEITVGSLAFAELGDGDRLNTAEPLGLTEMLGQVQPMARKLEDILGNISAITGNISNPNSPLMRSIDSLSNVLEKVDTGQGVAGRIVNSETMADELDAVIEEAGTLLAETTRAVTAVRRATDDLPATMASVRAVSADVEELAIALRESVARLPAITDDAAIAVTNLRDASVSFPSITARADRGVRRAGEVVDAAGRTIFLRSYMQEETRSLPQSSGVEFPTASMGGAHE